MEFDLDEIAVFSGARSLDVARFGLRQYAAWFPDRRLALIAPRDCLIEIAAEKIGAGLIADEDIAGYNEVRRFLFDNETIWRRYGRSGNWYLQQFLKFAYLAATPSRTVFVADGDTVFSRNFLGDMDRNAFRATVKEIHPPYDNLVGRLGLPVPPRSCVTNGGLFSRSLLPRPEALADWFMMVMRDHVLPGLPGADFSEYQIMAACWGDRIPARPIRLFRRFDLLIPSMAEERVAALISSALQRYDAVAVERSHASSLVRRIAARMLYAAGYSW